MASRLMTSRSIQDPTQEKRGIGRLHSSSGGADAFSLRRRLPYEARCSGAQVADHRLCWSWTMGLKSRGWEFVYPAPPAFAHPVPTENR